MTSRTLLPVAFVLLTGLATSACTAETEPGAGEAGDDRCNEEGVLCSAYGRRAYQNRAPAYELGNGTTAPTLKVIFQGQAGVDPVDLEFNPRRTTELWVTNYASNTVTKLNSIDGAVQGTFAVGSGPRGVAFDGSNIWVANTVSNTLSKR